jgi:cell wall-associated NlpC family hydrolase
MNDARSSTPPSLALLLRKTQVCAAGLCLGLGLMSAQAQQQLQPPPGMVMGAYGQSLQLAAATNPPAQATPLPASTATDPVSRFLQEQGLLNQAQGNSGKLLDQVRDKASDLVLSAMNFLGVRYKMGGTSVENGFDCSGFTRHIFEMSVGLVLPRRADEQARSSSLLSINKDDLKPGDLVFFNTMRATFSHVGIYVGDGKFVHAPRTGSAIRVDDMREAYWAKRFTGARRAAETHGAAANNDTAVR